MSFLNSNLKYKFDLLDHYLHEDWLGGGVVGSGISVSSVILVLYGAVVQ